MNLRRTALVAAVAAVALAAPRADAALTIAVSDPAGDVKGAGTGFDITRVTVGLTGTAAAPKNFEVAFDLVGQPKVDPGTSYQFVTTTGCGTFFVYAYWSIDEQGPSSSMQTAGCGGADPTDATDGQAEIFFEHKVEIKGKQILFSFPAKALPKEMGVGTTYDAVRAYTALTEPVVGYSTADFGTTDVRQAGAFDYATGPAFKLK